MVDRSDELEEVVIELLYLARECADLNAARKMRAAAELLTEAVQSLRGSDEPGASGDIADRRGLLSFLTSRV